MRTTLLAALVLLLSAAPSGAQGPVEDYQRYLALQDVEWRLTEGTNFRVTGLVVNSAPRPFRGIQIAILGYDEAGFPICNLGYTVPYVQGTDSTTFTFDGGAANEVHRVEAMIVGGALDPVR